MANNPLRPDIGNSGLTNNTLESEKLQNSGIINNQNTQSEQTQNNQNTQSGQISNPLRPDINRKDLTSAQLAEEMGLKRLKSYKSIEDPAANLKDKYKGMMDTREKYGEDYIDISKGLPNLQEMFIDDLAYEFYKELTGGESKPGKSKEILDSVFYTQNPPSKLGYSTDNTFTLEYTSKIAKEDLEKKLALNKVDGDTFFFDIDYLDDGGESFTMKNGESYESFKQYCKANNLDSLNLTVRSIGIQCPEIPHKTIQAMNKDNIVSMTIPEAKKKGALYKKYDYNEETGEVTSRKTDVKYDFYKSGDSYAEILEDGKNYMTSSDKNNTDSSYEYKVVLTQDESTKEGLADGYKAQQELADLIAKSKKIRLKLDANGTKANKTSGKNKTYYNHWWHVFDAIGAMADQWHQAASGDLPLSRLSFAPFGTDNYGRFIGEIYCLIEENGQEVWVNANKYILCKVDGTISNPEDSNIYGDTSNSFQLWDYDRDNLEYLDAFENQTGGNYTKRIKLHKEVTGIDFKRFRNCTMMLGDTLFLIPPTSIRNVSSVEYEKVNILRGKGSMVKNLSNKEQYLEIDLYFYDTYGINGMEYINTFPNGQQMTYYLDGLRSLVAQFHVAPYLPIENQYINDVLGIEVVSLVNLNIRTVEGFPRLLQATLTLRDFNYRIYMPDIPYDYEDKELGEIAEMNPVFAKCIHWEVFRYYYQRLILRGNELSDYEYGTKEYFDKIYNNKVTLKPTGFCDASDEISFYVPDENWLKTALEIKEERDYYGQEIIDVELTEKAKDFLKGLAKAGPSLNAYNDKLTPILLNCKMDGMALNHTAVFTESKRKNVFGRNEDGTAYTYLIKEQSDKSTDITKLLHNALDPIIEAGNNTGYLNYTQVDEIYNKNDKTLRWEIIFNVNYKDLSENEKTNIKEALKEATKSSNISEIFDDKKLKVTVTMNTSGTTLSSLSGVASDKSIIERLYQQYGVTSSSSSNGDKENSKIDTKSYFNENGISENVFKGYKKITVDGGDLSGHREPNVAVDIGFGDREYWGFTNEYGQLVRVIAKKITLQKDSELKDGKDRYYDDEAKVPGVEDSNFDEGHVIADSLGGVANAYNITPQNRTLNRTGSQSKLEKAIRDAGGCTDFVAIITYPDTNTQIPSHYSYTYNLNGEKIDTSFDNNDETPGMPEDGKSPSDVVVDEYDYRNPAAMQFRPFVEKVPLQGLACGMSNHFTEMSLKIMDGSAPQYMGASDISMELRIITENSFTVAMLNTLPSHAMNIAKTYRKILNCWPMRVKCAYLQLMGVNEALIDSVQIENMEGYPGVYDIRMRLTSVDRFMRQRETMKQLESNKLTTDAARAQISSYFDIEDTLSWAETYPDLDLPSLSELSQLGYKFIKYNHSNNVYPDPDFYMLYGFEYTAKIIKKNIKDVFLEGLLHSEQNEKAAIDDSGRPFMYMQDHSGQLIATNLTTTNGLEITDMNEAAERFTRAINDAAMVGEEEISKKLRKGEDKEYDETVATTGKALIQATLMDVQEGWELKPGWVATMSPVSTNLAIENCDDSNIAKTKNEDKSDIYAKEIFKLRKQAIELIDKILAEPLDFSKIPASEKKHINWHAQAIQTPITEAVKATFKDNKNGAALLKLLCPFCDLKDADTFAWNKHDSFASKMEKPKVLNYIQHFLHAAACALSGDEFKKGKSGFFQSGNDYEDYGARQHVLINGEDVPYCLCEQAGKPSTQAKSEEQALEHGIIFGMCQISKEKKSSILSRIEPTSQVDYLGGGKTFKIYKEYKDGFIDPYYNKLKSDSEELKEYIRKITISPYSNCYAFMRIVLMYLRKQIIDGYLISEIDLIAADNDLLKEMFSDTDKTWDEFNQAMEDTSFWESFRSGVLDMDNDGVEEGDWMTWINPVSWIDGVTRYFENVDRKIDANEIEDKTDKELDGELMMKLTEDIKASFAKSFCARWIYPFLEAGTQLPAGPNAAVKDYLSNRKFEQLNILSNSLLSTYSTSNELITKFLLITQGSITNLDSSNIEPSTTSNAQKLMNTIAREAFTKLAEDPQAYVLHSFYDMLVNDKRGRLVRAFPTYYVVFIDEGRKIGSWKLFDNFYNMSSIGDLTVTKSRKIPADTCSFTMTNMFGSYAGEYDNSTRLNYTDIYTVRDVFTSIFSPNTYIQKEDALARRKKLGDVTVLQPGVRLHIRMGYGSNAGRLPVVFNGKIAEIDVGDTVTIIGQGDGGELTNPLNALGEVEATNLIEAQQWTTICKDLRGSLARGGLSPRNLLSQILTAEHGGVWKTAIRNIFDDRYYGDNPFGIYHFGDKKFHDIFSEGEVVQNLYEVVDGTLLAGANELYPNKNTSMAAPTINTTITDKTFWDLLTMCAYSGVGYIGAVRDFGFRSTVFLGKPNHYYAYGYTKTDGKIIEKRKPFQQFHYYDSYTDIIYNSIKASGKNIKTNAVGVWEGTDMWWGQEQKTCGPLYVDINIYPEHQKSMTVDTGLIASGNGGIDIPFITHFSEEWNLNAESDKVNKRLAERITANTLRETMMNMYAGEICVIGDPSVKPYDRISISDSYESMTGQMEVEAVVYSMNFNTGFTTTIYPDLIVRMDDPLEPAVQSIMGNITASFITTLGTKYFIVDKLASVDSQAIRWAANLLKPLIKKVGETKAIELLANTAIGKYLGLNSTSAGGIKGLIEAIKGGVKISKGNLYALAILAVVAATVFCLTKNAKSFLTSWIRNIQMLDVYPIFKNERPFVAGMNGHKGSVVGYEYTEEDCKDSMQGMIVKCVENMKEWPLGIGKGLISVFLEHEEYQKTVLNWSNTLTQLETDLEIEDMTQVESIIQNAYGSVSKEFGARSKATQMLRTKYRIQSYDTNGGKDPTYLKYRNLGISPIKDVESKLIPGTGSEGSKYAVYASSLFTNKNILSLYPVEDDPEIKEAISKSHPNKVKFELAHSKGNKKDVLSFESGSRVIRYIIEDNPKSTFVNYPIMDLPMIQEDAMMVLKYILNDENLKGEKITFMSGARINDTRSWKNTGFAFELHCNDQKSLEKAVQSVKEKTYWLDNGKERPLFNYQMSGEICVITIYPEASPLK